MKKWLFLHLSGVRFMRRWGVLLIFVLSLCFAVRAEAKKFALLVGVNEYANVPSLRCCVNDMNTLKDALKKIGFEERDIKVLTTGSASIQNLPAKENIEQSIAGILSIAGPSDTVFFAFSGHGMRDGETDYFCPPFANPENVPATCVSITKVMDDLAHSKTGLKWMVVDACRNEATNSRDARAFQVIPAAPAGIVLFQSCAKGQKSYEEERAGGNGYFTKNFAAALSGAADSNHDGKLTLLEVCDWTTDQTEAEVQRVENKIQRPYLKGELSKVVLTEDLNVPKAKALAKKAHEKIEDGEYEEAIRLLDEAIRLCDSFDSWKRERNLAKKLLKAAHGPAGPTLPTSPRAGDRAVLKVDDVEFAFRWCPPGEFMMGSPTDEPGRYNEEKRHRVRLTKGFWMLETEVTQAQWKTIMGTTVEEQARKMLNDDTEYDFGGSLGKKTIRDLYGFQRDTPTEKILCGVGSDRPIYYVNWNESVEFCRRLSSRLNQRVQLPTEAQWEYACRAGSTTALPNGPIEIKGKCNAPALDPIAWYGGNSSQGFTGQSAWNSSSWPETQYPGGPCGVHAVGKKDANAWGLYDMIGNVWEWCSDYYDADYYDRSPTSDPENTTTSSYRVFRGGCWFNYAGYCRSAARSRVVPDYRYYCLGLRVLLVPSPAE